MRNISFFIFSILLISGCNAQKKLEGKSFNYNYTKEPTVLDNTIFFESDTTLTIYGGLGSYKYSSHPYYKRLNNSKYLIFYTNPKPINPSLKDTIAIKVEMKDVKNDTIYWKSDKEFIFRERLFKLYEYKGVPIEDQ